MHNLQSLVNVTYSDINRNGYDGIRVRDGAGHVNVTWCNVNYNHGDGIRINTAGILNELTLHCELGATMANERPANLKF